MINERKINKSFSRILKTKMLTKYSQCSQKHPSVGVTQSQMTRPSVAFIWKRMTHLDISLKLLYIDTSLQQPRLHHILD